MLTYGYPESVWAEAKAQARAFLSAVALQPGRLVTYKETAAAITAIRFAAHDHPLHNLLGQISIEADADGKGMLSSLVVDARTMFPGTGFFGVAKDLKRPVRDKDTFWQNEVHRVRAAHTHGAGT